jgi:hypothetical protein
MSNLNKDKDTEKAIHRRTSVFESLESLTCYKGVSVICDADVKNIYVFNDNLFLPDYVLKWKRSKKVFWVYIKPGHGSENKTISEFPVLKFESRPTAEQGVTLARIIKSRWELETSLQHQKNKDAQ